MESWIRGKRSQEVVRRWEVGRLNRRQRSVVVGGRELDRRHLRLTFPIQHSIQFQNPDVALMPKNLPIPDIRDVILR